MSDPIEEAIERGAVVSARLNAHRNAVIHHAAALFLITGADGLRACLAGVAETVIDANRSQLTLLQNEEARHGL